MNKNALPIKAAIVRHAVFSLHHILVAVEPSYQAHDVWSMSKNRFQYEWEIKQSMSDMYHELTKYKHGLGLIDAAKSSDWQAQSIPNYFSFVVQKKMGVSAIQWIERKLPFAGLVEVSVSGSIVLVQTVRRPLRIHSHRADFKRCTKVARWMAITIADTMHMHVKSLDPEKSS